MDKKMKVATTKDLCPALQKLAIQIYQKQFELSQHPIHRPLEKKDRGFRQGFLNLFSFLEKAA